MMKYIQQLSDKKEAKMNSVIDVKTKMETKAKENILQSLKKKPGLVIWEICAITGLNWDTVCLYLSRLCRDCLVKCISHSHTKSGIRAEYFRI